MSEFTRYRISGHVFDRAACRERTVLDAAVSRHGQTGVTLLAVLALAGVGWYLLHTSAGVFSRSASASRRAVQGAGSPADLSRRLQQNARDQSVELERSVLQMINRIRAVAREVEIPPEIERTLLELDAAARRLDLKALTELSGRTTSLLNQLNAAYEVRMVGDADGFWVFERELPERTESGTNGAVTGCFVVVEARDVSGGVLSQEILGAGADRPERVSRWAERVPKEVYDRIQAERASTGRLKDTLFAVKQRGHRDMELRLIGADGQPLARIGQLTAW